MNCIILNHTIFNNIKLYYIDIYNIPYIVHRLSDHVGLKALGMCIDLDHMTVYANRKYNAETSVKGSCIIIFLGIEFKQQQSFQVRHSCLLMFFVPSFYFLFCRKFLFSFAFYFFAFSFFFLRNILK